MKPSIEPLKRKIADAVSDFCNGDVRIRFWESHLGLNVILVSDLFEGTSNIDRNISIWNVINEMLTGEESKRVKTITADTPKEYSSKKLPEVAWYLKPHRTSRFQRMAKFS